MSKIIIKNNASMPDSDAIKLVAHVIERGRISNNGKQYCYLSWFKHDGRDVHVVTDLNKRSDRFTVYNPQYNSMQQDII